MKHTAFATESSSLKESNLAREAGASEALPLELQIDESQWLINQA